MPKPWSRRVDDDPFDVLGIPADADEATIVGARRRLAKHLHPDAGGTIEGMQRLNDAVDRALAVRRRCDHSATDAAGTAPPRPASRRPDERQRLRHGVRRDHPSFTIEALPVEAFEGLSVVAAWLGQVADDDPPYLLEVLLDEPMTAWCRLELVPDAGASTVSLMTGRVPGHPTPDVDEVRDAWIGALNQLDWTTLDPNRPPPS